MLENVRFRGLGLIFEDRISSRINQGDEKRRLEMSKVMVIVLNRFQNQKCGEEMRQNRYKWSRVVGYLEVK